MDSNFSVLIPTLIIATVFGCIATFFWVLNNLAFYRTLFHFALYERMGDKEKAVKITAPFNWGWDFVEGGWNYGGYDVFVPGALNIFWWFAHERNCRFKVSNFTDVEIIVGWAPRGGGDPRSPHFGDVILAPHSSKKVTVFGWWQGVVFTPYKTSTVDKLYSNVASSAYDPIPDAIVCDEGEE